MKMDISKYKQQAGCVPIKRDGNGTPCVLLVTNKSGKNWVLPKGSIEDKEVGQEAATRETSEEAGVVGDTVKPLGTFMDHDKKYTIHFFTLHVTIEKDKWREKKKRERKWFTIEDAISTVKKQYIVEVLEALKQTL